ncbi:squalene synthase HpnC [Sulfurivermis fontis]|uniref:squalene synthase HpnC n=1 Tax=Sulfurivermis fontis TaxID=1972068 RepID=UPI0018D50AEA|nr:squalene synthase HpnC [Sulfurivermis fontis]
MSADASTTAPASYTLAEAYAFCEQMARSHYENFPVASRLLPARLRRPTAVIYAFARSADDCADEGDRPQEMRLALLAGYDHELDAIARGEASRNPVFIALADVMARHGLPHPLFHDLVDAFRQDVTQRQYDDFAALLDYCRRSANPVGRLLLHLNDAASPENLALSDRICTALQLINFYQDLAQDYDENGRIYIPRDEMQHYGVGPEHFRDRRNDPALQELLRLQYRRARTLMLAGAPLGRRLRGRFGWEIRLIIAGGLRVLERLEQQVATAPFDRPRLRRRDWPGILWRSLFARLS